MATAGGVGSGPDRSTLASARERAELRPGEDATTVAALTGWDCMRM
jgi:hypothetical protein